MTDTLTDILIEAPDRIVFIADQSIDGCLSASYFNADSGTLRFCSIPKLSNFLNHKAKLIIEIAEDVSCLKNIYRTPLAAAEDIYGRPLRQDKLLPHLLCRPCERRLKNSISF